MAIDTVRDVLGAVPGATPTSTYRDPATNRRVGGAANSFHTRGTPDNPRAVDLVPAPGESMDQLEARLRSRGLNTTELLNEGDHIHVAVDGQPREQGGGGGQQPGYRSVNVQDLAPGDTPESLAAQGYQFDASTNRWFRNLDAPAPPTPLDSAYAERQAARESLALDQEEAQIIQAAMVPQSVLDGAGAVAGDVAKGVLLEGGGAVLSGIKRGFNATMDLIDEAGDWIETYVPGTVMWEGFDGDASTPMSIRLTTQNDAERRIREANGGANPSLLQRLGMAQITAPVRDNERPESVTGRLIEGVSQFATGFVGGGKALQGWKAAGTAGRIGKNLVQGALADFTAFDGQEERLSNLLAEHAPDALAPALNWLAADPNDGEVEGRFKNAIEGGILGGAVDVLGVGIRRLKAAREVRGAAREAARAEGLQIDPTLAMDEAAARGVEVQTAVREALGNPEAPRFRVRAEAPEAAAARDADLLSAEAAGREQDRVERATAAVEPARRAAMSPDDALGDLLRSLEADAVPSSGWAPDFAAAPERALVLTPSGKAFDITEARGARSAEEMSTAGGGGMSDAPGGLSHIILRNKVDAETAKLMKVSASGEGLPPYGEVTAFGGGETPSLSATFQSAPTRAQLRGLRGVAEAMGVEGRELHYSADDAGVFRVVNGKPGEGWARLSDDVATPVDPAMTTSRGEFDEAAFVRDFDGGEIRPVITPFQAKVADQATDGITPAATRTSTDNVFDINLARINTPEDVQAVIVGMADRMAKDVDLARRGTRSWDQTREAANGVDWVESMGARQPGGAVNAETALAYRLALNSSATKLDELSSALLDTTVKRSANEDLALQFSLRRAAATHAAIQNEFFGARAEAGRALNAFKIPADAPATYLRQIDSLLADAGGQGTAKDLARYIREAKAKGDVALNQMVRGGAMARSRDIIKLVYTNSLLSGLGTPIVNAVGTPIAMLYHVAARAVSPRLAGAFGGTAETQIGEASALVAGYIQATRDVFKLNPMEAAQRIGADNALELRSKGLFRGMAPGIDDAGDAMGLSLRSEREEAGAMAGAARPLGAAAWRVAEDTPLGRFLDIMQMIVEAPSNITGVTDDFWKVVSARGELHAQALRVSAREGLQGEAARARMADLIENPTDDMMVGAEKAMHELTFTRSDGEAEKLLQKLRRMADDNIIGPVPLATFILPFLRTPMNLMSLAARSSPLAPFSARFRASMRAGGAEAETAKAQAAIGTALWSVWMGMAMDGQITGSGPSNTEQRAAMMREDEYGNPMWQPYSVKQGGRWYSYERLDPVGSNLSLIGDFAELLNNDDWDGANLQEGTEIAANAVLALGQAYFDKSMLQGAIEFTSAMTSNDVSTGERFLMGRASALVPASGAARMLRRGQDPYMRETHNALDAMRNTVPLLSEGLPLQRDLWGRPRTYQTGLGTVYDAVMPVQTRAEGGSAIDLEILNNGVGVAMPARSLSYAGETVSLKNRPDIYSEFLRLSGEPAFEHLNAVAEGRHPDSEFYYSLDDGPSGGKAQYIKDVMSAYRDEARAAVSEMFASDLQVMAADKVRRREEARSAE